MVTEGSNDRYALAQSQYSHCAIFTDEGIPRYMLYESGAHERNPADIEADRLTLLTSPPTDIELLRQENEALHASIDMLTGLLAVTNENMAGFMDFYFTHNPE